MLFWKTSPQRRVGIIQARRGQCWKVWGKAVRLAGSEHRLPEKGCHLRLWDEPCLHVRSFIPSGAERVPERNDRIFSFSEWSLGGFCAGSRWGEGPGGVATSGAKVEAWQVGRPGQGSAQIDSRHTLEGKRLVLMLDKEKEKGYMINIFFLKEEVGSYPYSVFSTCHLVQASSLSLISFN